MSLPPREGVVLAPFTSWRVGGPARFFAEPADSREVAEALAWARERGYPWLVMGKGSNLLVADEGFEGLIIRLGERFGRCQIEGELAWAQAGCSNHALVRAAADAGRGGISFLSTIPGTVGGAIAMNAGAHGACVQEVLVEAEVLEPDGTQHVLAPHELGFAYRACALRGRGSVALAARFRTMPAPSQEIQAQVAELARWRRERQPQGLTAGSVFANPPGDSAGRLIESAGCKGLTVGRAQVSDVHANFFLNLGGATARDLRELIDQVQARVHAAAGVWLAPEVQGVGCRVGAHG